MLEETIEKLNNYKRQLKVLNDVTKEVKEKLNNLEIIIENAHIYNIDEIMPILEKIVNKMHNEEYTYKCYKFNGKNYITYYYTLTKIDLISNDITELNIWDYIDTDIIIPIANAKTKKELPEKISFYKNKNKEKIIANNTLSNTIYDITIKEFINYIVDKRLEENYIDLNKEANTYLYKKKKENKKLTRKK